MRKLTLSCIVVALSLMMTGMALAVDIPNISTWTQNMGVGGGGPGRGDVLIAPLYDVRTLTDTRLPAPFGTGAQEQFTLFCIVNTDREFGVVGRLRFREWKRSRECLDFDIPLTTNDVWCGELSRVPGVGFVIKTPVGGGERWIDADPTSTSFQAALFPAAGINSSTFAIELEEIDKPSRCEYGYFEFIGEERLGAPTSSGEPWRFPRIAVPATRDVRDVLMGMVYLIRPTQAISHQYAMTALSDFAVDPAGIWFSTATAQPNLFDNVQGGPGNVGTNPGIGGFNQLEAIISKRIVFLQYATGTDPADPSNTPMSTSAVVTFPTKHFHYDTTDNSAHAGGIGLARTTTPPFTGIRETLNDHLVTPVLGACSVGENVLHKIYDRKENTFAPGTPVSPPPQIPPGKLPYEVNVIGYYPISGSNPEFRNNVAVDTASGSAVFYTGYAMIDLGDNNQGEDNIVFNFFNNFFASYNGLPAMGIVMTEFFNDSVIGYYGNTIPWRYKVDWQVTATAVNLIDLRTPTNIEF